MNLNPFKKTSGDPIAIVKASGDLPEVQAARQAAARLAELEAGIAKIDGAIAEQEAKRNAMDAPVIPEVAVERAEIAAKVALGEAGEAELTEYDRRTIKARAEAEEAARRHRATINDLDRTLTALRRRRAVAQAEADSLREQSQTVRGAALRAVAARVGEQYIKALEVAAPLVSTLCALSSLSNDSDGGELYRHAQRTGWPEFYLDGMGEKIDSLNRTARPPHGETAEDEAALEQLHGALSAIGIRC